MFTATFSLWFPRAYLHTWSPCWRQQSPAAPCQGMPFRHPCLPHPPLRLSRPLPQPLQRPYFASPFPAALTIDLLNPFVLCVHVCIRDHLANHKSWYTKKWFQRKAGGSATCCKNITPEIEFNFIPAVILLLFDYPHASFFFFSFTAFHFLSPAPQMFAFVACCHPARCQFNFKNCCFVSFRMTNFIAWDCRKQGLQEHIWLDHPTAGWI